MSYYYGGEQERRHVLLDSVRKLGLDLVLHGELPTDKLQEAVDKERERIRMLAIVHYHEGDRGEAKRLLATIDEDEDTLDDLFRRSGKECADCEDHILFSDEVFLITVVRPSVSLDGLSYNIVESDDNDFLYEPRFFDVECWENQLEDLREHMENRPPILELRAILDCSICASGIKENELIGLVTFGEIQHSERCPDGEATSKFVPMDPDPTIICTACLWYMNENVIRLWEGSVQNVDECEEGTFIRCWRYGCDGTSDCKKLVES